MFRVGDKVKIVATCKTSDNKNGEIGYITSVQVGLLDGHGTSEICQFEGRVSGWEPACALRLIDDSFGQSVASEIESEMHQLDELIERRLEEIEQLKYK